MKNKKLTYYVLLPLAAVIWGLILWKIFHKEGPTIISPDVKSVISRTEEKGLSQDTFHLMANYPDPFLKAEPVYRNVTPVIKNTREQPVTRRRVQRVRWPNIRYGGLVNNPGKGIQIGLINIDNRDFLIKDGEQVNDYTILKIFRDSVHVSYREETKTFFKNN